MKIDNDLILQWEPKINRMLSNIYVQGYDRDDLAQELRMIVLKAAKLYKPNRNAIFHTYLHTAMVNRLKTLWMQSSKKIHGQSLDATTSDEAGEGSYKLSDFVKQLDENLDEVEFIDYLESLDLDEGEKLNSKANIGRYLFAKPLTKNRPIVRGKATYRGYKEGK